MIQSILSNIAVILIMHLLISAVYTLNQSRLRKDLLLIGIVSLAVIAIFYLPFIYKGYRFDLRLVPLLFIALNRGWVITLPVLFVACLWRWMLGGDGVFPGILFGMVLPTLTTLLFHRDNQSSYRLAKKIAVFSLAWMISDVSILFWIGDGGEFFRQIFILRFFSFLVASILVYNLIEYTAKQIHLHEQLQYDATHDPLTGIFNQRALLDQLSRIPVTDQQFLAVLDIDYFKSVNDQYGHLTGDRVLVTVAHYLADLQSNKFLAARYGGEEFILFLESGSQEEAWEQLEKIRIDISRKRFLTEGGSELPQVTVSIGFTRFVERHHFIQAFARADQMLYKAKKSGRNRVIGEEMPDKEEAHA